MYNVRSGYKRKKVVEKISLGLKLSQNDIIQLDAGKDGEFLVEIVSSKKPLELVESAIFQLSRDFPEQRNLLIDILNLDNNYWPDARRKAIKNLSCKEDKRILLKAYRREPSPAVRVAIVNQEKDSNSKLLREAIDDIDPYVRGMAVEKINKNKHASLLEQLVLDDPHPYVRLSSILRVNKDNLGLFKSALRDSDEGVRQFAEKMILDHLS